MYREHAGQEWTNSDVWIELFSKQRNKYSIKYVKWYWWIVLHCMDWKNYCAFQLCTVFIRITQSHLQNVNCTHRNIWIQCVHIDTKWRNYACLYYTKLYSRQHTALWPLLFMLYDNFGHNNTTTSRESQRSTAVNYMKTCISILYIYMDTNLYYIQLLHIIYTYVAKSRREWRSVKLTTDTTCSWWSSLLLSFSTVIISSLLLSSFAVSDYIATCSSSMLYRIQLFQWQQRSVAHQLWRRKHATFSTTFFHWKYSIRIIYLLKCENGNS